MADYRHIEIIENRFFIDIAASHKQKLSFFKNSRWRSAVKLSYL